jgi:hypothetical protein
MNEIYTIDHSMMKELKHERSEVLYDIIEKNLYENERMVITQSELILGLPVLPIISVNMYENLLEMIMLHICLIEP